ncbi:MAG: NAD-dependent deacylase [Thermodesulfobacteriota bacterium]
MSGASGSKTIDRPLPVIYNCLMDDLYIKAAELLNNSRRTIALTGAGVSAESGIPTFRNDDGLWKKYDPAIYASYEVFLRDPSKYWEMRGDFIRTYNSLAPNNAHKALAKMERLGKLDQIITQNIDGLHSKAGNREVIEIHGNLQESSCMTCNREFTPANLPEGIPPYCPCGGVIKPSTVLFGEPMPEEAMERALFESSHCNLMLVIGTSATVQPAASLPVIAMDHGARLIEINPEPALFHADLRIPEQAGRALPALLDNLP